MDAPLPAPSSFDRAGAHSLAPIRRDPKRSQRRGRILFTEEVVFALGDFAVVGGPRRVADDRHARRVLLVRGFADVRLPGPRDVGIRVVMEEVVVERMPLPPRGVVRRRPVGRRRRRSRLAVRTRTGASTALTRASVPVGMACGEQARDVAEGERHVVAVDLHRRKARDDGVAELGGAREHFQRHLHDRVVGEFAQLPEERFEPRVQCGRRAQVRDAGAHGVRERRRRLYERGRGRPQQVHEFGR